MPISTRLAKSNVKKVSKNRSASLKGSLNRGAAAINPAEADNLTPGAVPRRFNVQENRRAKKKQNAIIENRRRRH